MGLGFHSRLGILLFLLVSPPFSSFLFLLPSSHMHLWTGIFRKIFFPIGFQSAVSWATLLWSFTHFRGSSKQHKNSRSDGGL